MERDRKIFKIKKRYKYRIIKHDHMKKVLLEVVGIKY